jgi:hypothetical protein
LLSKVNAKLYERKFKDLPWVGHSLCSPMSGHLSGFGQSASTRSDPARSSTPASTRAAPMRLTAITCGFSKQRQPSDEAARKISLIWQLATLIT